MLFSRPWSLAASSWQQQPSENIKIENNFKLMQDFRNVPVDQMFL